jgi:hypothetical protein
MHTRLALFCALALAAGRAPAGADPHGFTVDVLVDGRPMPVYFAHGTRYVEAFEGKDYAIRLHNPLPVRVAVALSVDGLNTIDARHTTTARARKWVLDPYETVTIRGWQTSMEQARRFFFTSEERSYARWMGQPQNIGVISAVFFRERVPAGVPLGVEESRGPSTPDPDRAQERARSDAPAAQSAPSGPAAEASGRPSRDEYAATGIGRRTDHRVQLVHVDLEDHPVATIDMRYEYRPQLVRLGVLPPWPGADALARRQRARGFEPGFCPEPPR